MKIAKIVYKIIKHILACLLLVAIGVPVGFIFGARGDCSQQEFSWEGVIFVAICGCFVYFLFHFTTYIKEKKEDKKRTISQSSNIETSKTNNIQSNDNSVNDDKNN